MRTTITCLACSHAYEVECPEGIDAKSCFESGVFQCRECNARMSFGKLMPRVVTEPFSDERGITWVRRKYVDAKTGDLLFVVDLDAQYAASAAKNDLSLVIP